MSDTPLARLLASETCPEEVREFDGLKWKRMDAHQRIGEIVIFDMAEEALTSLAAKLERSESRLDSRETLTQRALEIARTTGHSFPEAVEVLEKIARYDVEHEHE